MTDREWFGRVLLAMLAVNTLLSIVVAQVSVSRFELDGRFDFFYWLVFVGPAFIVGSVAALVAWTATLVVVAVLARFVPRVHRSAVSAIGLVTPGVVALLVYLSWMQPSEIQQPARLPEILFALVIGGLLAVVVVHRVNRAAASLAPREHC